MSVLVFKAIWLSWLLFLQVSEGALCVVSNNTLTAKPDTNCYLTYYYPSIEVRLVMDVNMSTKSGASLALPLSINTGSSQMLNVFNVKQLAFLTECRVVDCRLLRFKKVEIVMQ